MRCECGPGLSLRPTRPPALPLSECRGRAYKRMEGDAKRAAVVACKKHVPAEHRCTDPTAQEDQTKMCREVHLGRLRDALHQSRAASPVGSVVE